ncbi:Nif3-like dinuclear metal center hexameric protein [Sphingobacterium sp. DK4209]|uniref:GTP cyclohydrolase 1 type 2 homolog n=1 Tax=Sphingobacterium zhuxiongii TaxID=2662364 RepID=A0A5Q0QE72_9SPHI|nr:MULTISPECIES: Nif3-like dinuclear metal center hexameric protein [unclassified Sphingobacterium]MVZ65870.1 Nif3-like dinuclear metal center hexameric protein [Sphingobacterium sp. DK4209]QGA28115.1 Nif3-like dinuclear metal center hexameric protein [Sphingobacterium sp. dk4302]
MKIKDITKYLEEIAPLNYQESYDNSGLIVGNPEQEINSVLISLDCTEAVVEEAISKNCGLIISHHPIVFSGLKKLTGRNYVERTVIKAIKNDIAIYAIHTNLDNIQGGVSSMMADKLGLENQAILRPKEGLLKKLVVYVPRTHVDALRASLFEAGAGQIGDYDQCSYNTAGYGTFRPLSGANPTIGQIGEQERVEETKIEVIFPVQQERKILVAMFASHPYEEVAYHIINLENTHSYVGSGAIGNLAEPMSEENFLALLKDRFDLKVIRHTTTLSKEINRVALCGGAGGFLLNDAIRSGADIFITADYKYHEFFDAEGKILIADIGHFESEQFTQELLFEIIRKKFANFAVLLTEIDTNPIKYYS